MSYKNEALTEDFLLELYSAVFANDEMASIVANHMDEDYLPDRPFVQLQKSIRTYVKTNKSA
ncbi:MAG: DnaB-like helicase C-terminal domain-containing protein, partial [Bacteroidales bacterium]